MSARKGRLTLTIEALAWLAVAELARRGLPFRHVVRLLQPAVVAKDLKPGEADRIADRVAWAIAAAARRAPWRAVCFHEAIAAQRMLARRGVAAVAHYGVLRDDQGHLPAHIWISVADRIVVGGGVGDHVRVTGFAARPARG